MKITIRKKSNKPFKSGLKIEEVNDTIFINPHSLKPAYKMNDGCFVNVEICRVIDNKD